MDDDLFYATGVDMETGQYTVRPMGLGALDALIRREEPAQDIKNLEARTQNKAHLALMAGYDPKDIAAAGWGVVFPDDVDPAVESALAPLIQCRRDQAGKRCQRLAYRVGQDTKGRFLARYGAGPGPVDPDVVPYYLMLVGGPDKIPYLIQSQLDVDYSVGRIDFDTAEQYARYAASVVAAERGEVKLGRRMGFFDPGHEPAPPGEAAPSTPVDGATSQSAQYLVTPLLQRLGRHAEWQLNSRRAGEATRAALADWLGEGERQALVFAACHGLEVKPGNALNRPQREYQGALVCADWPGLGSPMTDDTCFFAGKDVRNDVDLRGMIAVFFACFGAGTPKLDAFGRLQILRRGQQPGPATDLTDKPFVAELPRRLLAAPGGGALAVVGHVERTWPSSFVWKRMEDGTLPPQTAAFESMLASLMDGVPVGAAVEYLNMRYASLAVELKDLLDAVESDFPYDRVELANVWMASNDAQWYTVVGDPAVRLPLGSQ